MKITKPPPGPEYNFKRTRKVIIEVSDSEIDRVITVFLNKKKIPMNGVTYVSQKENEWSDNSSHVFDVKPKSPAAQRIEDLSTETILNWMCADGILEPGEYLINVSW